MFRCGFGKSQLNPPKAAKNQESSPRFPKFRPLEKILGQGYSNKWLTISVFNFVFARKLVKMPRNGEESLIFYFWHIHLKIQSKKYIKSLCFFKEKVEDYLGLEDFLAPLDVWCLSKWECRSQIVFRAPLSNILPSKYCSGTKSASSGPIVCQGTATCKHCAKTHLVASAGC